jgi:23S rRNA (cytidine1920-2'-O)/16S rRNA (cytidine1409-2'-O)-methyltransferase
VKDRADKVLVDRGLVSSRSQAKSLIEKGDVVCNGKPITKAGELISINAEIEVKTSLYVGRGAFKLEKALQEFPVVVKDKIVIDVGASTGGFTEVLLANGAARVYAVDVGHGQLAPKLLADPRVMNLEKTNIRELESLPELAQAAVMDLSFISITKVVENLRQLVIPGADLIALIKPQFEATPSLIPKDGVIKDPELQQQLVHQVISDLALKGWSFHQLTASPITGKTGNQEFLAWFSAS